MEGSAIDYISMENVLERVGREEFHRMVKEVSPPVIDWKQLALRSVLAVTVLFWCAVSENPFEWEIPAEVAYPLAVAHVFAVKKWIIAA